MVYFLEKKILMYKKLPTYRYKKTLKMLKEVCPAPSVVFDLGVRNPFSDIMKKYNNNIYKKREK